MKFGTKTKLALLMACIPVMGFAQQAESPKEVATAFFKMAFTEGKAVEAAKRYISEHKYIQHRPDSVDGREAFIKGIGSYLEHSTLRCEIKHVIAEGDLVFIHNHCKNNWKDPKDRGTAIADLFRVENGKVVEHWDIEQAVPETAKNTNTMF